MGPAASMDQLTGMHPVRGTSPHVGLSPTTPHQAAGPRIDPPVSSPSVKPASAAAAATPDPADEMVKAVTIAFWDRYLG